MSIRRLLISTALTALASWLASSPAQAGYTFQNIINPLDPTFNQELGINNSGLISGYFGIGGGVMGHPNQGYTHSGGVFSPTTNFPGSVQTQLTGLNNNGTVVGFWAPSNNGNDPNYGFYEQSGKFITVVNPGTPSPPTVNQLLGVNDSNVAVGFYNDALGNSHGYTYNITTTTFTGINYPSAASTTAAGINNAGDIVGFYSTVTGGPANGFLDVGGSFTMLDAPGSTSTMLLGINNKGLIVGTDTDANGMHGVIYNELTNSWTVLDDPNGIGTTTFNGLNDLGQIVGFYVDGDGNTIGLLASAPAPEAGKGVLGSEPVLR
ncbi:MAG: hypothetical protein WBS22_11445 [Methylocystis sp.]